MLHMSKGCALVPAASAIEALIRKTSDHGNICLG